MRKSQQGTKSNLTVNHADYKVNFLWVTTVVNKATNKSYLTSLLPGKLGLYALKVKDPEVE